ncbi:hypothetical protein J6590_029867, partial [Homalodisca vitripennis]
FKSCMKPLPRPLYITCVVLQRCMLLCFRVCGKHHSVFWNLDYTVKPLATLISRTTIPLIITYHIRQFAVP